MNRLTYYSVPALLIIFFVIFLNAGNYLKQPIGQDDQFFRFLAQTKNDVQKSNWAEAKDALSKVKSAWKIVHERIQLITERDEISEMDIAIARLDGAILAKDQSSSLINISEITSLWDHLGE